MYRYIKRIALLTVMLVVIAGIAGVAGYNHVLKQPLTIPQEGVVIAFNRGETVGHLAEELASKGFTSYPSVLRIHARLSGQAHRLKAGEYRILPGTNMASLLALLVGGKVIQYSFTVIEGHTTAQTLMALQQHPSITSTIQYDDLSRLLAAWGSPFPHPEGAFLPDTYFFTKGMTDEAFLKRAHDDLVVYLNRQWQTRAVELPLHSAYEGLILASIVEKETSVPEERPLISGVFINRLKKNMRLQTDPTVIYGLGEQYDGDIRYRDLRRDTPYNTYTRSGLTPTPIALASKESIHAAFHPEATKALYFVAKGDGTHHFSESLREHNNAVKKYQLTR